MPVISDTSILYEGWTKLIRVKLRLPDGQTITREVEDHGRAVSVLPYDPDRRMALMVRLLRAPVLFAAGSDGELLECPAGLMDEDDPAEAARREAHEEVGLQLSTLEHVGAIWSMPGISTERMELFLAPYSLADRVTEGGGVDAEHENITVVEMPLDDLWSLVSNRQLVDHKTLTLVLLLRTRHPHLFRDEMP